MLITWATPDEVPDFGIDLLGEAGPLSSSTPSGDRTYVSGAVAFDPVHLAIAQRRYGDAMVAATMLHEFGHLLGLAHVNNPTQIMFARANPKITGYGSGDLAGLAALGRGACQPDI